MLETRANSNNKTALVARLTCHGFYTITAKFREQSAILLTNVTRKNGKNPRRQEIVKTILRTSGKHYLL